MDVKDDAYWEAVDLHYWGTNNLEWCAQPKSDYICSEKFANRYDPAALTTKSGALEITLSKKETHGLNYQGGMMSTWNKFCFTGGILEANVSLPGASDIVLVSLYVYGDPELTILFTTVDYGLQC